MSLFVVSFFRPFRFRLLLLTPVAWFLSPGLPWLWRLAFTGATVATLSSSPRPTLHADWMTWEVVAASREKSDRWLVYSPSVSFTRAQRQISTSDVTFIDCRECQADRWEMTECHVTHIIQNAATAAYLCNLFRLIINIMQHLEVHSWFVSQQYHQLVSEISLKSVCVTLYV